MVSALTIAFDTTIVGALALPWVYLIIHLFFFEEENKCVILFRWIRKQQLTVPAGVLLFALTYSLGSVVERVSQDFFNDDDLYFRVGCRMFRFGDTEDRILTSVYCERAWGDQDLLLAGTGNPSLIKKIQNFDCQRTRTCPPGQGETKEKAKGALSECERRKEGRLRAYRDMCRPDDNPDGLVTGQTGSAKNRPVNFCVQTRNWYVGVDDEWDDDEFNATAADLFGLQEAAILLKGEDFTQRLRQLHDQIIVLRGAAFNAIVGFSLCLFICAVYAAREKPQSWLRWALAAIPFLFLIVAGSAFLHHLRDCYTAAPPYMEFSLALIGLAGVVLLKKNAAAKRVPAKNEPVLGKWAGLTALSAVLAVASVLGWWATEVMYAQEVIYHYDSQWPTSAPVTTTTTSSTPATPATTNRP
jgi:hypothetical protein